MDRTRVRLATFPLSIPQLRTGWRDHPGYADRVLDPATYVRIAQLAERGHFDYLFLPDKNTTNSLPGEDHGVEGNSWPDPYTLMAYLAPLTERIGLVATASTAWSEPYVIARMFATLDHLTGGRAGWNAVSSHMGLEDHNFAHRPTLDGDARKRQHAEFVQLVTELWDSWQADAVLADSEAGRWAADDSVRQVDHAGEFFSVAGPLNVQRTPQGRPLIVQAGASEAFRAGAARSADVVFTRFTALDEAVEFTADLRRKVDEAGRPPGSVLVIPIATFDLTDAPVAMDGQLHFTGTGAQIAQAMVDVVAAGGADGFTLLPAALPDDLERFVDEVVPELVRLGAVSDQSAGSTVRERLGLPALP